METEIVITLAILTVTVLLLLFDVLRMDVLAILCMLALALTGILSPGESLSGFSSNAVIAMVAVMILGRGIARTGLMDRFARLILHWAGSDRAKLILLVSVAVGLLSAIIQNVGAAVLFLPAVLRISRQEKIPASELIMPIGFAAILGGNLTMVGSGSLILINDLLGDASLRAYRLFDVLPVGLALLISGIAFFHFFGRFVLPRAAPSQDKKSAQKELIEAWHLPSAIWHYTIPIGSAIIGKTAEQTGVWDHYHLNILGITKGKVTEYAPWRETQFEAGQNLALLGEESDVQRFAADYGLRLDKRGYRLQSLHDPDSAGFAEILVPPRSSLAGQTIRQYRFRQRHAVEPVMLFHQQKEVRGDLSDIPIAPSDILIVHGLWDNITELRSDTDIVLITEIKFEEKDPSKAWLAVICFASAIILALAGLPISIAFLSGAIAMVLTRVIDIEEAYQTIDWKVVFFLAGLIPLGIAMQKTGAAAMLAGQVMRLVQGQHPIWLLFAIALLSTVFSLLMSNVAATVVLAPLAINMAQIGGLDPRPLALLVAVCAGNSFILPTHQVNALLKSPGGYHNADYLRAGGAMTMIFLIIAVALFYLLYL